MNKLTLGQGKRVVFYETIEPAVREPVRNTPPAERPTSKWP